MARTKLFSVLALALLAASPFAQNAKLGVTASIQNLRESLFKAMEVSSKINVEAIVMRKGYHGSPMQFKFEQNERGISKFTVTAPLCDQNAVRYEDRHFWKNFNPDKGQLIVQPISGNPNSNIAVRQALAEQNYKFVTEVGDRVAGRPTVVIVAIPKAAVMPSRRYSIDVAKMYILRVETELKGDRQTLTDTVSVKYSKFLNISDPEREFFSQFRKFELDPPVSVSDPKKLTEMVGFRPALPQELPYGFAIIDKQAMGEDLDTVAIRITDGLASATILQSRNEHGPKGPREPSPTRADSNGYHFKLMGELPDPVIRRILEIFAREALKGLMPLLETSMSAQLLNNTQNDAGAPMLIAVIIRAA